MRWPPPRRPRRATASRRAARPGARPWPRRSSRAGRCLETFGVDFIDPVSPYTLSDRATKYGLLFIALTFVGVAAVEVLRRVRVQPDPVRAGRRRAVDLLPAAGEPLGARRLRHRLRRGVVPPCTLLLAFYGTFVLRGMRAGAAFGAGIAALFGALYLLLQLEQTALLIGSTMLFGVLAVVMVATRRVDWYALFASMRGPEPAAAPVA